MLREDADRILIDSRERDRDAVQHEAARRGDRFRGEGFVCRRDDTVAEL